ncbi:lasso peptide biosynthesis B2 protein [Brevibacillus brevis]|nr:lasso peptide biosynthesis B2 protein [Brevibacillus brevis]
MKEIFTAFPKFINVYLELINVDLQLRKKGFHTAYLKYITRHKSYKSKLKLYNDEQLSKEVNNFLYLIDKVCRLYPFEAQCIHRSFLGYRFLREKLGFPVELVIGVKKYPFSAHAWLMFQGFNVNESEEYTSEFQVILSSEEGVQR